MPIKALTSKLAVGQYDKPAPFEKRAVNPKKVVLPLKQGAGVPNRALVKAGDRVSAGQPLGEIPEGQLGAIIHAPFAGKVESVTDRIILSRTA